MSLESPVADRDAPESSYLDEDAGSLDSARRRPVLVPLVTEPGKPLPPAANLSMNLAVVFRDGDGRRRFGSVELPPVIPRFVRVPPRPGGTGVRVLPVEQVVEAHLPELFAS